MRSSLDNAVTPKSAVDEEEEDIVLCIESGLARERLLGSNSASSRAVRLPLRGGPPKLNRLGRQPRESDVDMAGETPGDDGESRALAPIPSVRAGLGAISREGGKRDVDEGRVRSDEESAVAVEEFHAEGVRSVDPANSGPKLAAVVLAVGVLTMSESASELRRGV